VHSFGHEHEIVIKFWVTFVGSLFSPKIVPSTISDVPFHSLYYYLEGLRCTISWVVSKSENGIDFHHGRQDVFQVEKLIEFSTFCTSWTRKKIEFSYSKKTKVWHLFEPQLAFAPPYTPPPSTPLPKLSRFVPATTVITMILLSPYPITCSR
jgi:hypothetical protein